MPDSAGPSGNFTSTPVQGWLHSDQQITKKGVSYSVHYVGCLDVNISMKSLDFDSRFQIAKESINRVCEAAGLKTADQKRKVDKRVLRAIGEHPNMINAGSAVTLSISSSCLTLKLQDNDTVIARHDMPRISFASGGDADTLDFVAYVAKDSNNCRACYVLECGGGLAQNVISTIGQAFNLRYRQFIKPLFEPDVRDHEYYNDMPGKVPPDAPPPIPPLPNMNNTSAVTSRNKPRERLPSTNLIDLNCEVAAPPLYKPEIREYMNDIIADETKNHQPRDVFDMQPFNSDIICPNSNLRNEIWYHGSISRQQAEALLKQDGDFLVRESQGSPGQYVLTGIQGGVKKHLLLIDPEGVVRTKDRMFESVSHLINYHCQNKLPIISAESALILTTPVLRS